MNYKMALNHTVSSSSSSSCSVPSWRRHLFWKFVLSISFVKSGQSCLSEDMSAVNDSCLNTRKIPLYIGGMMPLSVGWDGTGCLVAAEFALEQINNRQDILPEYELIMLWNDTQCANGRPLRALYDQVVVGEKTKVAILGPSCSPGANLLAAASKHWNLLTILFAAISPTLSNKSEYPNVYRTVPIATNVFNDPFIWLIRKYGWSRVAFISKSALSFSMIQENFVEKASKLNVSVVTEVIQDSAGNQVENLKNLDIRIIFSYAFEEDARQIFCEAYKKALSGENIVWVLPSWFQDKWWLIDDEKVDCTIQEVADMIESSLIIGVDVQPISPLNKTTVAGITSAEYLNEVTKRLSWPQYENYTLNNYMAYAYDAVWAIALMLNSSAAKMKERNSANRLEDFTYHDTGMYQLFFRKMAATDFFGASGHVNFFRGERLGTSEISQFRGHCQMGWTLYKRHCYKFNFKYILDWNMASLSCSQDGAYLADTVTDEDIRNQRHLLSSVMNNTFIQWHVGRHSADNVTDNRTHPTSMDIGVQDRPTDGNFTVFDFPEVDYPEVESNLCPYVDFNDTDPLKRGNCEEERPFICQKKADFAFLPIAVYDSISDEMTWTDEIRWLDGKVPLDRPVYVETMTRRIEVLLPGYIHILLLALAVIGLAVVLVNTSLTIWFSGKSVFRHSHPRLSYIVLLGCFLLYSSAILTKSQLLSSLTDKHFILLCEIRAITISIGFTLGVSTLVVKVWLVYTTTALNSSRKEFPDVRLIYRMIAFFVCIDALCLVIRHLCFPLNTIIIPLGEEVDPSNPHIIKEFYVKTCTSSGDVTLPWLLTFVDKIILLLLGMFLSVEIRKVSLHGESRQVTISIYSIVIFGACGLILVVLLENDPINSVLFSSVLIICCTSIILMLMFLPKEKQQPSGSTRETDLNFYGPVPRELQAENSRLKAQLKELRDLLHERRRFSKVLPPSETVNEVYT